MNTNIPLKTVSDCIAAKFHTLTRSEKRLAEFFLDNYPFSAIGSIATVAEQSGVSGPTVVRMVQKLGYPGYSDFQTRLHQELEETFSNPITRRERWHSTAPETHVLNRFAEAMVSNLRTSLSEISTDSFDAAVRGLSDRKNQVFLAGGRMTYALATYLFNHLQVIRPGVTLISPNLGTWRHFLLNMKPGDVLTMFDIRRYDREAELLAKRASELGAHVILFTDNWGSPASKWAETVFRLRIDIHASWDSSVVTLYLLEALIEGVQSVDWNKTRERLSALEDTLDDTRLFHKGLEGKGKKE